MSYSTWAAVRRDYENALIGEGKKPSTVKVRVGHMDRLIGWRKNDELTAITTRELLEHLAKPEWASPSTRRAFHGSLSAFFDWAASNGVVPSDPTIPLTKMTVPKRKTVAATDTAIRRALSVAPDRERLMIKLAFVAGMKPSEIASCNRRDLRREKSGAHVLRVAKGAESRTIVIPASLATELEAHSGYIFRGRINGHISPGYVSKLIGKAMPDGETAEQVRRAYTVRLEKDAGLEQWATVAPFHSAKNLGLPSHVEISTSSDLRRHLDLIDNNLTGDPRSAIDSCKNLLETLFKTLIINRGEVVSDRADLPGLYKQLSTLVVGSGDSVSRNARGRESVVLALNGATTVVNAIARLRNSLGDGHGATGDIEPAPRYARLAFNATVTVAEFVMDEIEQYAEPRATD